MLNNKYSILFALTLGLLALLAMPAALHAQAQKISFQKQYGMTGMAVSLLRNPDMPEGHFILRLSPENRLITGCIGIDDMAYSANYTANALNIEITGTDSHTENLPLNPHLECNGNVQTPKADIPLSRDDLLARGIRHIRFQAGALMDMYELNVSKQNVSLSPSLMKQSGEQVIKPQKTYGIKDFTKLWFYPEGTVIAFVPGIEPGRKIRNQVDTLMSRNGFEPLENRYPAFQSPLAMPYHYYYVDKNAKLSQLSSVDSGYPFGHITVDNKVYGLNADKIVGKNVPVFVRHPDTFE